MVEIFRPLRRDGSLGVHLRAVEDKETFGDCGSGRAGSGVRDLKKLKKGAEIDQSGNIKLPVNLPPCRT